MEFNPNIQGNQGNTAKYIELSNQAYGLIVDALASATRSSFDYWKSVWKIASRPNVSTEYRALEVCFARAFESAPFGMSLVSARPESLGRYIQANQAYCEMVGYPQEELLTMAVSSVVHPDDAEHFAEVVHDLSVGRAAAIEC